MRKGPSRLRTRPGLRNRRARPLVAVHPDLRSRAWLRVAAGGSREGSLQHGHELPDLGPRRLGLDPSARASTGRSPLGSPLGSSPASRGRTAPLMGPAPWMLEDSCEQWPPAEVA
eukprot:9099637-Pyramimonas_sp.AAC.1